MKHILFALVTTIALVMVHACTNEPSCRLEGKWKVETCDIKTEKLSPTIINIARDEYLNSVYEFQKEGKILIHHRTDEHTSTNEGTYTFDDTTQSLSWQTVNTNGTTGGETFEVASCTETAITLTQRLPNDPQKEEIATITLTLNRAQ